MIKGINHVGIAVKDLNSAVHFFQQMYGAKVISRTNYENQDLENALLGIGDVRLELLASLSPEGFIAQFIENRGEGIHHISLDVDQFEKVVFDFKSKGMRVLGETQNADFKACFIHPKENFGVLTELVELRRGSTADIIMNRRTENMEEVKSFEKLKPMLRPTGVEWGIMKVDPEKCTCCGLCILNCPMKCLEMDENQHPTMQSQDLCGSCFNCMAACPADALSIEREYDVKGGFFDTQNPTSKMPLSPNDADGNPTEWNQVERIVLERRSVRNFKKNPVPESLILRVLEAGRFAPSGGNHQPWKFTVVTNPELMAELETTMHGFWAQVSSVFENDDTVMNMVGVVETGVFDPRTQIGIKSIASKVLPVYFGAPVVIFMGAHPKLNNPALTIGICGENMNIVANSLGLGVCWTNFGAVALNQMPELKSRLGFEEPWSVITALALGYPKFNQSGMVPRHYRPVTWFRAGSKEPPILY